MTQSLASLLNDVYALTNRPDLVSETTLAVKSATLKAHRTDFYPKDIFETGVVFDFPSAQQALEYRTLVPRWRALKYLRKFTPDDSTGNTSSGTPGAFIDIILPEQVLDGYSINRDNVCYLAGAEIQIRSSEAQQYYLLGCYVLPDVTTESYYSWIAEEQPTAIIYEAAAVIFKTIGYDEQNATYQSLRNEEYAQLKMNISADGF